MRPTNSSPRKRSRRESAAISQSEMFAVEEWSAHHVLSDNKLAPSLSAIEQQIIQKQQQMAAVQKELEDLEAMRRRKVHDDKVGDPFPDPEIQPRNLHIPCVSLALVFRFLHFREPVAPTAEAAAPVAQESKEEKEYLDSHASTHHEVKQQEKDKWSGMVAAIRVCKHFYNSFDARSEFPPAGLVVDFKHTTPILQSLPHCFSPTGPNHFGPLSKSFSRLARHIKSFSGWQVEAESFGHLHQILTCFPNYIYGACYLKLKPSIFPSCASFAVQRLMLQVAAFDSSSHEDSAEWLNATLRSISTMPQLYSFKLYVDGKEFSDHWDFSILHEATKLTHFFLTTTCNRSPLRLSSKQIKDLQMLPHQVCVPCLIQRDGLDRAEALLTSKSPLRWDSLAAENYGWLQIPNSLGLRLASLKLSRLRIDVLTPTDGNQPVIQYLAQMTSLTELDLMNIKQGRGHSQALAAFPHLVQLTSLYLNRCAFSSANMTEILSTLPQLHCLTIDGCQQIQSLMFLSAPSLAVSLETLLIRNCPISDPESHHLLPLQHLHTLHVDLIWPRVDLPSLKDQFKPWTKIHAAITRNVPPPKVKHDRAITKEDVGVSMEDVGVPVELPALRSFIFKTQGRHFPCPDLYRPVVQEGVAQAHVALPGELINEILSFMMVLSEGVMILSDNEEMDDV